MQPSDLNGTVTEGTVQALGAELNLDLTDTYDQA